VSVSYDRAGLGWRQPSDTRPLPSLLAENFEALSAKQPFLVHIFWSAIPSVLVVRSFAEHHPSEVSGLALVDRCLPVNGGRYPTPRKRLVAQSAITPRKIPCANRFVRLCLSAVLSGRERFPKLAAKFTSGSSFSSNNTPRRRDPKLPKDVWPIIASHWSPSNSFESMARHL